MGRASRRQQRADEELQSLSISNDKAGTQDVHSDDQADENSDSVHHLPQNVSNAFASFSSLMEDAGTVEEEAEEEETNEFEAKTKKVKSKKKKSKKKPLLQPVGKPPESYDRFLSLPSSQTARGSKLADKTSQTDEQMDEIDAALKDLRNKTDHINKPDQSSQPCTGTQDAQAIHHLLAIDSKMLDSDQELRRMFGARVISSVSQNTPPSLTAYYGPRISNNPHHHLNLKSKATVLAKPQLGWDHHTRTSSGLSMKCLDRAEMEAAGLAWSQDSWFCFEHSISFRALQSRFISAILSLDPNQLMLLLRTSPYHPDTLLQLSEVSGEQGDPGQSLDFLNRSLYSFEKSFHPAFNLSKGDCRLDFKNIENRSFFRALEKKVQVLMRRGCWRTAFETCKLLLSLNPYRDPYGALLWIDFLAPKAKQYQFFLDLMKKLPDIQNQDPSGGIFTEAYPGLYYSEALCLRALEEKNKSKDHDPSNLALEAAILRFPQVLIPLSQAIGLDLPLTIRRVKRATPQIGFSEASGNVLHFQSQVYVSRAASLWKESSTCSWLQEIVNQCHSKLEDPSDPDVVLGEEFAKTCNHSIAPDGIYRTVFVSDVQALKKFLPPAVAQIDHYSFDPFPPRDGTFYDETYFKNTTSNPNQPRSRQSNRLPGNEEQADERQLMEANLALLAQLGQEAGDTDLNGLIEQLQGVIQADHDLLEPADREMLLNRLDLLLERAAQHDRDDREDEQQAAAPVIPDGNTDDRPFQETEPIDAQSEASFNDSFQIRMPGAFWDS